MTARNYGLPYCDFKDADISLTGFCVFNQPWLSYLMEARRRIWVKLKMSRELRKFEISMVILFQVCCRATDMGRNQQKLHFLWSVGYNVLFVILPVVLSIK